METHHTEKFDSQLEKLDIYQRYPVVKPFIGKKFEDAPAKIIFIAESHYLPNNRGELLRKEYYQRDEKWLDQQLKRFADEGHLDEVNNKWEEAKNWINPRFLANEDANRTDYEKPIYKNMLEVFTKVFGQKLNINHYKKSFPYITFCNYFLRPSETNGTIKSNVDGDYQWGYKNMVELATMLNPDKIVLCSMHVKTWGIDAWATKDEGHNIDQDIGPGKMIYLRHPTGHGHWNKQHPEYGGKNSPQYLEEKLRELL